MAVLTETAVLELALAAGFTRTEANIMTAIAHFESGWDAKNVGDQTLSHYGSRGLWQIFTGAHSPSEVLGQGGSSTSDWTPALIADLEVPSANAHAAHVVYKEQGFTAWSTYNSFHASGSFQALVSSASKIVSTTVPEVPVPAKPATDAVESAEAQVKSPSQNWHNECLVFVRTRFGLAADGREGTAAASWTDCPAGKRHPSKDGKDAPADVPFVFSGGSAGAGHIVVMKGDGKGGCVSSDWPNDDGRVGDATVLEVLAKWSNLKAEGWMEELEGHVVYTAPTPAPAPVPVHPPVAGGSSNGNYANFPGSAAFKIGHSDPAVWVLGVRLQAAGFAKHFSHGQSAYAPSHVFELHDLLNLKAFQEAQGWSGANADGFPGPATWSHLGAAAHWKVS